MTSTTSLTQRIAFVILGMHRSGTSALTRVINLLGADISSNLMPEQNFNERGFWESWDIYELHCAMLSEVNMDWDSLDPFPAEWFQSNAAHNYKNRFIELIQRDFANSSSIVLKDPRMCILVSFWDSILREAGFAPHYIIPFRNPSEVARSIHKHHLRPFLLSYLLWLQHVLEAELGTRGMKRCFVSYDMLLENWHEVAVKIFNDLELPFPDITEAIRAEIDTFLTPSLRHYAESIDEFEQRPDVSRWVKEVYRATFKFIDTDSPSARAIFDKVRREFEEAGPFFVPLINEQQRIHQETIDRFLNSEKALVDERDAARLAHFAAQEAHLQAEQRIVEITALKDSIQQQLDQAIIHHNELEGLLYGLRAQLSHIDEVVAGAHRHIYGLTHALEAMRASTSWKITQPLRAVTGIIKRLSSAATGKPSQASSDNSPDRAGSVPLPSLPAKKNALRRLPELLAADSPSFLARIPGLSALHRRFASPATPLTREEAWLAARTPSRRDLQAMFDSVKDFSFTPLISVLMPVYNAPQQHLAEAIDSVRFQIYPNWELCIVDDASTEPHVQPLLQEYARLDERIKVVRNERNLYIAGATNRALALSKGEFVGFIDNDDKLFPHTLYECVALLQNWRDRDMIYTDNILIDENSHTFGLSLKPTWSPEFYLVTNYVIHFCLYSRKILQAAGPMREEPEYHAVQDMDLKFKVMEHTERIAFIPKPLYQWRVILSSVSTRAGAKPFIIDNSILCANDHFQRIAKPNVRRVRPDHFVKADVGAFKLDFGTLPSRSIALLLRWHGGTPDLQQIERQLLDPTDWEKRVCCILAPTQEVFNSLTAQANPTSIQLACVPDTSSLVSLVHTLDCDYVGLLDACVHPVDSNWLRELAGYLEISDGIGCVGGKILSQQNEVHSGAFLLLNELQTLNQNLPDESSGYWFNNQLAHNVTAVSDNCLLTRKSLFLEAKGLDYGQFGPYACVDFCLRLAERGIRTVYNPWAKMHLAQAQDWGNASAQYENLKIRHGVRFGHDPYYNPGFSQERQFELAE